MQPKIQYNALDSTEFDEKEILDYFETLAKKVDHEPASVRPIEFEASRVLMVIHQEGLLGQEKNFWKSCQHLVEKLFTQGCKNDYCDILRWFDWNLNKQRPHTSGAQAVVERQYLESTMIIHGFKKYITGINRNLSSVSGLISEYTLDFPKDNEIILHEENISNVKILTYRAEFLKPF